MVAGALDPFENRTTSWHSVAPLAFMRKLLCISTGAHPHATCKARVHFDIWSHHPYTFGGPFGHARLPDDVSLGDLPKMSALLQTAERLHRIVSHDKIQFWVMEFAGMKPPNLDAMPIALHARAVAEALHQMWLSGVSLVTWYLLQDAPTPYQCGLYFGEADRRGAGEADANRLPLPVRRLPAARRRQHLGPGRHVRQEARDDPALARRASHVAHGRQGAHQPSRHLRRQASPRAANTDWLSARAPGSGTSLAFSLTQPRYPHIGPWG